MTTAPTMTDEDWEAMFAPFTSPAKPAGIPAAQAAPAPTTTDLEIPTPTVRTADEIVAAQAAKDDGLPPEPPVSSELFRPLSLPIRGGAMGDPPPPSRHQSTARTEIVAVRAELGEMMRMLREIHTRVAGGQ